MANQNTGNNIMQTNSIIPNEAFNTTLNQGLNQGLNPGDYYGFPSVGCTQQGCVPNVVNQEKYMIPSVEQIAAYHNQQIGRTGTSSPTAASGSTALQGLQENVSSNQNVVPSTPATTFDYGATLESSLMDGITDIQHPYPVTAESLQYLNGFLRTQIGRRVSIDFLVGSNSIVTKSGFLLGVASNYILINELDTNDLTTCDFYNIKFIRFYY